MSHIIGCLLTVCIWLLSLFQPGCLYANTADTSGAAKTGVVYGRIFSNFHAGINKNTDDPGFEISRAYLGYLKEIGEGFEANIKLDIGSPEDVSPYSLLRRYAYFRNAYLKYTHNNISAYFGIIELLHFKAQEKYWGHRYIEKSFADRYRFGNSADLGAQVIYRLHDMFTADITFMNGEGYTKLQSDNTFKVGSGISFHPGDALFLRVYADASDRAGLTESTITLFAGSKLGKRVMMGAEYNYEGNTGFRKDHNMFGYSLYASCNLFTKWQVFARFDKVLSNKPAGAINPWNLPKDGSAVIAGIEFSPLSKLKFSVNYQDWFSYAADMQDEQFVFLNMEVVF